MNTQGEDQEGTSVERWNQEGLEGSNAPSRPKRRDTSQPSITDTVPPHIVAEMQMMKEHMNFMMNTLRGRVSSDLDDLVHRTDSSFIASITSFPLPPKFRMPQVENFDGSKDPLDHLEFFMTLIHLQGASNEIICRAFPTTLKGPVRIWFSRLTPNFISTFKDLSTQFALHFIGGHRYKNSTSCLMNIKQWEDETLRSYITGFNKEALLIDKADDKSSWRHSPMGYERVSSYFLCIRMTQRQCRMCFTRQPSTLMRKMHYWPKKRSPRKGKDKKTNRWTRGGRWLEPENDRMTDAPNPL